MAGFRKATSEQAAIKAAVYGPAGSGKTVLALMIAEHLCQKTGCRAAGIDTERGTDLYTIAVPERKWHPKEFDFDVIHTRSIMEVTSELKKLDPKTHGVIFIDSVTHLWEACRNAYRGKTTRAGTIPMHAWSEIKKPWKDLVNFLLNCPQHVIICGRQGNDFQEDEETGELKTIGYKMKAEGEVQYEPHILLRLAITQKSKGKDGIPTAFVEKDRSGVLSGKVIEWPNGEKVVGQILPLLGNRQGVVQSEDDAAFADVEAMALADRARDVQSQNTRERFVARFRLADSKEAAEAVGKEITASIKKDMAPADVTAMKVAYLEAVERIKKTGNGHSNGHRHDEPGAADKEDKFRQIQEAIPAVNSKTASNTLWEQINSQRDWLGAEAVKTLMDHLMQHNAATWNKPKASKPEPAAALLPARELGDDSDDDR